ncbi:hypothetical protein D9M72_500220 [compost metagenome]
MDVEADTFGKDAAHVRAGEAEDDAPVALVDDIGAPVAELFEATHEPARRLHLGDHQPFPGA